MQALELATIGDHVRAALALGRRLLAEGDDVLALRWFEVAAARGGIIARRDVAAALRDRPALEQRAWAEAIEAGDPYAVHQFGLEPYTRGEVERAEGVWAASARAAVAEKMCCVANALEFTDPDRARAWSRRDRNVDGLAYDGRSRQDTADLRIEHVDAAETATRTCASAGELVACVGGPMTGGSLRVSPGEGTPGA